MRDNFTGTEDNRFNSFKTASSFKGGGGGMNSPMIKSPLTLVHRLIATYNSWRRIPVIMRMMYNFFKFEIADFIYLFVNVQ